MSGTHNFKSTDVYKKVDSLYGSFCNEILCGNDGAVVVHRKDLLFAVSDLIEGQDPDTVAAECPYEFFEERRDFREAYPDLSDKGTTGHLVE